jgi:DNA-binding NtrC family response regulator
MFRLISKEAVKMLESYSWPGNIRELRNTIERIILLYDEIELRPEHLNFLNLNNEQMLKETGKFILKPGSYSLPDDELNLRELELEIVEKTLEKFHGNKSKAARYLDLTISALRSRLK